MGLAPALHHKYKTRIETFTSAKHTSVLWKSEKDCIRLGLDHLKEVGNNIFVDGACWFNPNIEQPLMGKKFRLYFFGISMLQKFFLCR